MNILFLSELFYPHGGGGELATDLYSKLLSKEGHKVVVITNKFSGESSFSQNNNLQIYRLPLFKREKYNKYLILQRFDVLSSTFFTKMLKWADIVYIPGFWYSAIPIAKLHGKPVITHLHGYVTICPIAVNYNSIENNICKYSGKFCSPKCIFLAEKSDGRSTYEGITSAALNFVFGNIYYKSVVLSDAVICVSIAQREILCSAFPFLRSKSYVIYNPLPYLPYISLEGDDFAYFGGSTKIKGYGVLRRALEKTNKKMVLHATKFSNSSPKVIHLSNGSTIIECGSVRGEQMDNIYRSSRAVIVPSICQEPYGYVASEALIRGRFVIASSIGGLPEVTAGCPGTLLFRPGDYRELSDQLDTVQGLSRERVVDLGAQNREVILKKFSNEIIIEQFMDLMARFIN